MANVEQPYLFKLVHVYGDLGRIINHLCTAHLIIMPWLYTTNGVIVPPLSFEVLDERLRFELAYLEFHMLFGNAEHQKQLVSLRTDMYQYLRSGQKGDPPKQFFLWLFNMYTGKQPFPEDQNDGDDMEYQAGVSIEGK